MSAPPKRSLPRLPVARRAENSENVEDSSAWAVSYADMLMVLLSFFILFYSAGGEQTESVIQRILAELPSHPKDGASKSGASVGGARGLAANPEDPTKSPTEGLSAELTTTLENFPVTHRIIGAEMIIDFPESLFPPGQSELPRASRAIFENIMARLKPFENSVQLRFVGHTDAQPIAHPRLPHVESNFDLSVWRAARALSHAIRMGFNPKALEAAGAGEHGRNTRSLSLVIRQKPSTP